MSPLCPHCGDPDAFCTCLSQQGAAARATHEKVLREEGAAQERARLAALLTERAAAAEAAFSIFGSVGLSAARLQGRALALREVLKALGEGT